MSTMSMSSSNAILKLPFKAIEIPLNKFNNDALPHHLLLYEQHKDAVHKFMSDKNTQQLSREISDERRAVRQLKDLVYEIDTLRARVEDEDLDKFDTRTFGLRKSISAIIKDYAALQKSASQFVDSQNEINENIENENPFLGAGRIQIHDNLEQLKLQQDQNRLGHVEALNEDIQDLHGMYQELNTMVHNQQPSVDVIEENVEAASVHTYEGLKHIIGAYKLNNAAYPATGLVIGGLLGGPIGLIAGLKAGGLASLGCGLAGYTGGQFFKKFNNKSTGVDDITNENSKIDDVTNQAGDKKDI